MRESIFCSSAALADTSTSRFARLALISSFNFEMVACSSDSSTAFSLRVPSRVLISFCICAFRALISANIFSISSALAFDTVSSSDLLLITLSFSSDSLAMSSFNFETRPSIFINSAFFTLIVFSALIRVVLTLFFKRIISASNSDSSVSFSFIDRSLSFVCLIMSAFKSAISASFCFSSSSLAFIEFSEFDLILESCTSS
mmetsp:Transcript_14068/g.29436  ORF Transcript_14068/g.29436 Transcript_14068/m.29436 type:complete len:201 (-) Transcript_14068:1021-1623(-)